MIKRCAWCEHTEIEQCRSLQAVTHAICSQCLRDLMQGKSQDLMIFINTIPNPILVVDGNGNVLSMNFAATLLAEEKSRSYFGKPLGFVLQCRHNRLPGGCGNTIECKTCRLRQAIEDSFDTGKVAYDLPVDLIQNGSEKGKKRPLHITTEKIKEMVFLRLE